MGPLVQFIVALSPASPVVENPKLSFYSVRGGQVPMTVLPLVS